MRKRVNSFRNMIAFMPLFCAIEGGEMLRAETVPGAAPATFAHPVLDRWRNPDGDSNRKRLETEVQEIMGLSEAQLLAVIPEQTPRIHHPCPVCARKKPAAVLPEQPAP